MEDKDIQGHMIDLKRFNEIYILNTNVVASQNTPKYIKTHIVSNMYSMNVLQ